MNIYQIGVAYGKELAAKRGEAYGVKIGTAQTLVKNIDSAMKNFGIDLQQACEGLGTSIEEYENAKQTLALLDEDAPTSSDDTDDEI